MSLNRNDSYRGHNYYTARDNSLSDISRSRDNTSRSRSRPNRNSIFGSNNRSRSYSRSASRSYSRSF